MIGSVNLALGEGGEGLPQEPQEPFRFDTIPSHTLSLVGVTFQTENRIAPRTRMRIVAL